MSANIPPGFAPLRISMGFLETNGPLYGKWENEKLHLGFRVEARHCNPGMVAHGGMMATFADMQLPLAARFQSKLDPGFSPTVNLTCDFVAPAPLGAWVEGSAEMIRATRNLLFVQGTATADGQICLRANGIFRIVKIANEAFTLENLFGPIAGRPGLTALTSCDVHFHE